MWTYEAVELALVEALGVAKALPDRERGWLAVKACWPDIVRERALGDYDALGYLGTSDDAPAPRVPLLREQIDGMERCEAWIGRWVEARDRRLVMLALGYIASGRRVGWAKIGKLWRARGGIDGSGEVVTAATLAKRYERAVAMICCGLNGWPQGRVKAVLGARARAEMALRGVGGADASADGAGTRVRRRKVDVEVVYG